MGYKYIILGGGMGKAVAYDLLTYADTENIAIVDKDKNILNIVGRMNPRRHQTCCYLVSGIEKLDLRALFGSVDVVISAMPAKYNLELARIAIKAGTNFCDMGGVIGVTKDQIKLNRLAIEQGVSVVPDCGLMPGMGIVMAKKLTQELDLTHDITIYVGGLPQKPRPPLYYQRVFNMNGLASICYEKAPVLVNGRITNLPPFSGMEVFFVKELNGQVEAFVTAGASIAPWTFRKMGVMNFSEKTVRWPGFVNYVKDIPREKFSEKILPHINIPVTAEDPDLVWMEVEAIGLKNRKREVISYSILDRFDTKTGLTAMERTTGFATAKIARMIARGRVALGVNTPETAFAGKDLTALWQELGKTFDIKKFELSKS